MNYNGEKMIPKKIHYFWFGGKEKPKKVIKCLKSWKKYCPDYEIIEWNESNFDIHIIPYIEQAYEARKFAFVSDVARLIVIYEQGGIYMDTDVELLKPLDDLLINKAYMSFENNENVNTGQGFGAISGLSFFKEHIDLYKSVNFQNSDGTYNMKACTKYTTALLVEKGLKLNGQKQSVDYVTIYPEKYFNPLDSSTGKLNTTKDTYSIHWYASSWMDRPQFLLYLGRFIRRIFGINSLKWIKRLLNRGG